MKTVGILTALLSILIFGCSQPSFSQSSGSAETQTISMPHIPQKLDFAGEEVPLDNFAVRESLMKEMLVTEYMHAKTFQTLLNRERYFDIIEPILRRNGIPEDFKYLCMAESGLNPEARSGAGAAGLWQIMPKTGKEYGLRVEQQIDERYNIEKATEAACKYLLEAYERFGNWTLAAAAYNAGNNGIKRRIDIQGTDNYYDTFLPQETMRYVYRVLALKLISSDPAAYGYILDEKDYFPALNDYKMVKVSGKDIKWPEVAQNHGTNYKMLRLLNPWIRDYEYANKEELTFDVKIPSKEFRNR